MGDDERRSVLAALVPVGWWCPVHGNFLCPEHYMLNSKDGEPWAEYQRHWSEDLRCGKRQATYRIKEDLA